MKSPIYVLMAVFNGAERLPEQLASIERQRDVVWKLIARDDGSADNSVALLEDFAAASGATILKAARLEPHGAAENFLGLLRFVAKQTDPAPWIAFSDQDDIWLEDKLARAQSALNGHTDGPALYCSRSLIVEADISKKRLSPPRPRPPAFRNALVQNIAAGNTILLNPDAARIVLMAAEMVEEIVVHDWWIYQLITGAGGTIIHDDEPSLLYRQHQDNQIGANDTWPARLQRIRQLLRGDLRDWTNVNIAALRTARNLLSHENRSVLTDFEEMRGQRLVKRLMSARRLGLYRQSLFGNLALWLAIVLGKL